MKYVLSLQFQGVYFPTLNLPLLVMLFNATLDCSNRLIYSCIYSLDAVKILPGMLIFNKAFLDKW